MRLTKIGHSCVRLEKDGATLVIDPGNWNDPDAAVGADVILITHEHPDHVDEGLIRAAAEVTPGLEVWTNDVVAGQLGGIGVPVHAVGDGDAFAAAGFDVQVHGRDHGVIHPDLPVVRNVGFLFDGALFHPGDAFTIPAGSTPYALLLPVHAPWFRLADAVDYTREVRPAQAFAVHEAMLNDLGLALIDRVLGSALDIGAEYRRLRPGEAVDIP